MQHLTVKDLMTEKVFSVSPRDDLATVYDLLDSLHVRHIPVVNQNGDLMGLVSQRDLIRTTLFAADELPLSQQRELLQSKRVSEIMAEEVETTDPDEDISEAGRIMLENKFGCLPVVEGNQLVGILTEADFVAYVVEHANVDRAQVA